MNDGQFMVVIVGGGSILFIALGALLYMYSKAGSSRSSKGSSSGPSGIYVLTSIKARIQDQNVIQPLCRMETGYKVLDRNNRARFSFVKPEKPKIKRGTKIKTKVKQDSIGIYLDDSELVEYFGSGQPVLTSFNTWCLVSDLKEGKILYGNKKITRVTSEIPRELSRPRLMSLNGKTGNSDIVTQAGIVCKMLTAKKKK